MHEKEVSILSIYYITIYDALTHVIHNYSQFGSFERSMATYMALWYSLSQKTFIVAIMYIKFIKYTKLCDKYNSVSKLAACNCSNSD